MIIWRGWGILALLITVLFCLPAGLGIEALLGSEFVPFGIAAALVLAGVSVFLLGQRLNAPRPGYHPQTGQPVLYRNQHTLFFVPMQYVGFVLLGASVLLLVAGVVTIL
ncbi:hypothetical protein [Streptomonospora litoralis]|uniref:Uncharacterized protein n=1 Tax=Streptomonospora litoralis TaxID=2498135 RepID=A0A4P6PY90_9ACTN|nr:hypothetical protein [Streptomonospora litoralis]QBI52660.1 hypothetical protein EKD16_04260 [Streptomonospora litoralis]